MQAVKVAQLIRPGAIVDNASWTSQVVDTLGFDYATAIFQLGATDIAMAALKLQESDNNSSWADIAATDFSNSSNLDMDGTALALPAAGDDNLLEVVHLDMTKRKRYLQCVATAGDGTSGTYLSALMILSRAEKAPNASADQGAEFVVVV